MRTYDNRYNAPYCISVGMKPLSERDENNIGQCNAYGLAFYVGMKPLSERDENLIYHGYW